MDATSRIPGDTPIARTAVDDDEEATDALLRAARRAHVDLDEADPQLYDQIDAGALDSLTAHSRANERSGDFVLVADLWDRTFVVRPDAVEVYP
ncbi:HalOD1 output domain-containing protein [Halosimplex halophilum]|uniref:HalOD1 output domain-containing protein n=1 Tax=Halosimplex halophilum TaxID=2559572 RepID=UPI00107F3D54|nr:HalOD1 output domain-containing protein [Halosimplex halophilum]